VLQWFWRKNLPNHTYLGADIIAVASPFLEAAGIYV